ncbi:MAG TPA: hypothetical protein VGN03_03595, partial [Steroidobacteraceae bacterium]
PKVRAPGPERSQEGWLESRGLRHPHRGPRGPGASVRGEALPLYAARATRGIRAAVLRAVPLRAACAAPVSPGAPRALFLVVSASGVVAHGGRYRR